MDKRKEEYTVEVNCIWAFEGKFIPTEVKSGTEGQLKFLHLYMDIVPHTMAVRFYPDEISKAQTSTPGVKTYQLLNLPYYLVSQVDQYLQWFQKEDTRKK